MLRFSLVWGTFSFLLFACAPADPGSTGKTSGPADPNQVMAALLDSLARTANPMDCYHLNSQRAAYWGQQLAQSQDLSQQISLRFQMANELLNAGKTEDAIKEFTLLKQQVEQLQIGLNAQTKNIYDLLAVAYLRLGEQENCLEQYASSACILPLQPEALHRFTRGSENAIALYLEILKVFPDDLQSQWLLNLAYMTLGRYPGDVPAQWLIPPAAFSTDERFPAFPNVAIELGVDDKGLSGGVCMEDFNNDGRLDLFVTSYGLSDQVHLYIQQADGTFDDQSEAAGLTGIVSGLNTLHADYNNDGWTDVLILRGGWLGKGGNHPNSLLRNNGDGTFTDVTQSAGLLSFHPTQVGAWADFNNDGHLDLFIGNESTGGVAHPSALYVNNGDGTFSDVARETGLNLSAFVKGAAWGDVDQNGLPDLYVSILGEPNRLYLNRGGASPRAWTFEEQATAAGVAEPVLSFPTWFWDFDNDGDLDLFVSGYDLRRLGTVAADMAQEFLNQGLEAETPRIYRNDGKGRFEDMTTAMGLDKTMYSMGSNFGDLNNDGFLDFYVGTGAPDLRSVVPNRMFLSQKGQSFQEITMAGFGHIQKGHGIAFGDIDRDGDEDIYCVMGGAFEGDLANNVLFANPLSGSNWITVRLVGTTTNRSAIGSRIRVVLKDEKGVERSIFRTVGTGGSFGASSLQQEIGLGDSETLEQIEIQWAGVASPPSVFRNIQMNRFIEIQQGSDEVKYMDLK